VLKLLKSNFCPTKSNCVQHSVSAESFFVILSDWCWSSANLESLPIKYTVALSHLQICHFPWHLPRTPWTVRVFEDSPLTGIRALTGTCWWRSMRCNVMALPRIRAIILCSPFQIFVALCFSSRVFCLLGQGLCQAYPSKVKHPPWAHLKCVKLGIPRKVNQNISKHHGQRFRRDLFRTGWFHRILCTRCSKISILSYVYFGRFEQGNPMAQRGQQCAHHASLQLDPMAQRVGYVSSHTRIQWHSLVSRIVHCTCVGSYMIYMIGVVALLERGRQWMPRMSNPIGTSCKSWNRTWTYQHLPKCNGAHAKKQSLPTTPKMRVAQETSKTQRAHDFRTTRTTYITQWPSTIGNTVLVRKRAFASFWLLSAK